MANPAIVAEVAAREARQLQGVGSQLGQRLADCEMSTEDLSIGELVERVRPPALREFDQIPMRRADLVRQVRSVAALVQGQSVAFVGDSDAASLMLGVIASRGGPAPAAMLLLDFDRRLLANARRFADEYGFSDLLSVQAYNVFDRVPEELVDRFDWFYVNPPYGSRNAGLSGRLFITRGMEMVKQAAGQGCAILPCDPDRPWTQRAWSETERFLRDHGWAVSTKIDQVHRYPLDDDPDLMSSTILVQSVSSGSIRCLPFAGRRVDFDEVPNFYGRAVKPPFPRYICEDGTKDLDWEILGAWLHDEQRTLA